MEKLKIRKKFIVFLFCLLSIFSLVLSYVAYSLTIPRELKIIKGQIDIKNAGSKVIVLSGEWEFYPEKLYQPYDFLKKTIKEKKYSDLSLEDDKSFNYATYKMTVHNIGKEKRFGLSLENLNSNYKLWINKNQVFENVILKNELKTGIKEKYHYFKIKEDSMEIVLQIFNYQRKTTTNYTKIKLAREKDLKKAIAMDLFFKSFILGAIFLVGIYYLGIYLVKKEKPSLFFSCLSLIIGIKIFVKDLIPKQVFTVEISETMRFTLESLSYFLGVIFFIFYFYSIYKKYILKKILDILMLSLVLLPMILLYLNKDLETRIINSFGIISIIIGLYYVFVLLKVIIKEQNEEDVLFLCGFILLFGSIINDFLLYNKMLKTVETFNGGFFAFILLQTVILAFKYSKTDLQKEILSEKLVLYTKSLEQTINTRTEELERANKILKKAKLEAEGANESKSRFLANTSHELRTPLNGIIGMLEMIETNNFEQDQKRKFDIVYNSANHLLKVINDILDISKIEAGKTEMEVRAFDIRENIEKMINLFFFKAKGKNLDFVVYISPKLPRTLYGDPLRLNQVINNLLSNALKFTEKGEVVFYVDFIERTSHNVEVFFSVKDTGIGIDTEKLDRLFKSFSQLDNSHSRIYGGTGLGLNISKQLVEAMNGKLEVETDLEKGSVFYFSLPFKCSGNNEVVKLKDKEALLLVDSKNLNSFFMKVLNDLNVGVVKTSQWIELEELIKTEDFFNENTLIIIESKFLQKNDELKEVLKEVSNQVILLLNYEDKIKDFETYEFNSIIEKPVRQKKVYYAITGKKQEDFSQKKIYVDKVKSIGDKKVLIVEDNEVNIEVLKEMLDRMEIDYKIAKDGEIALEKVEEETFDVILMDLQLPKLNGFEITRIIREKEEMEKIKPVKIIAVTAHSFKGYKEECIKAGMDDYISKPIEIKSLYEILKKNINIMPFDVISFQKKFNENREFTSKLIKIFLSIYPESIEKIKTALRKNNFEIIEREAHRLKASSAHIKAERLYSLLKILEKTAKEKEERDLKYLCKQIELEFNKIKKYFLDERRPFNESINNR